MFDAVADPAYAAVRWAVVAPAFDVRMASVTPPGAMVTWRLVCGPSASLCITTSGYSHIHISLQLELLSPSSNPIERAHLVGSASLIASRPLDWSFGTSGSANSAAAGFVIENDFIPVESPNSQTPRPAR